MSHKELISAAVATGIHSKPYCDLGDCEMNCKYIVLVHLNTRFFLTISSPVCQRCNCCVTGSGMNQNRLKLYQLRIFKQQGASKK